MYLSLQSGLSWQLLAQLLSCLVLPSVRFSQWSFSSTGTRSTGSPDNTGLVSREEKQWRQEGSGESVLRFLSSVATQLPNSKHEHSLSSAKPAAAPKRDSRFLSFIEPRVSLLHGRTGCCWRATLPRRTTAR